MKEAIKKHRLEDKIILSAAFCLGRCTDGVSVKIDNEVICSVSKENFDEFFRDYILARVR
jgi:NADH:ubiquinone oxidoreductase subunit E